MLEEYYASEEQEELANLNEWVDSLNINEALSGIKQKLEKDFTSSFDTWFKSLDEDDESRPEILRSSIRGLALGHCFELESQAWNLFMLGLMDRSVYENFNKRILEHHLKISADAERWMSHEEEATQQEV